MTTQTQTKMQKFEVTMWEKAEHRYFEEMVEATDETAARKQIKKNYPRGYSISRVTPRGN